MQRMAGWGLGDDRDGVGIGVVGLGYWGPNIVRNLVGLPGARLVALCDLDRASLAAAARRFAPDWTTTRFDDLLSEDSIDGVVIATPIATHRELVGAALAAGKHVLVEKPLAASTPQALELLAMRGARQVLMIGHTFLYSPAVNAIRRLLRDGAAGTIHFISASRVNLGLHRSDASVVWDLGPHDFSILCYWLGELPVSVTALGRDCLGSGQPDVAFVTLEYASGVIAHAELSWLAPGKLRRTTIVGSRRMIVYDDTSTEPVRIFDAGVTVHAPETFGEFRLMYRTGQIVSPPVPLQEPLRLELEDFVGAIVRGLPPRSGARLGLDVVRIAEAADRSMALGGLKVMVGSDDDRSAPVLEPPGRALP